MKKIMYIDMDGTLVDFQSGINRLDAATKEEFTNRLDEVPGIFALMDPMPGALETYRELVNRYDVYILSTSPWENDTAPGHKLQWVKKHLGQPAHKRLILSHHKHLNRGDYLIDDRDANGAKHFTGEWIHFRSQKFPDWDAVRGYLVG